MQIYLAKPGSQKEGPFTLEEINRDLAAKKYSHNDYWAWYEGLPQWLPLYEIPGVGVAADVAPQSRPAPATVSPATTAPAISPQIVKAAAPAEQIQAGPPETTSTAIPRPATQFEKPVAQPKPIQIVPKKPATPAPAPAASGKAATPARAANEVSPAPAVAAASKPEKPPAPFKPEVPSKPAAPVEKAAPVAPPAPVTGKTEALARPSGPSAASKPEKPPALVKPEAPSKRAALVEKGAPLAPPASVAGRTETPGKPLLASGLPFAALEHIFIFTTGEGRLLFQSEAVVRKLQEIVGKPVAAIREKAPVDVIGHANVGVEMMLNRAIPDKAWRALFSIKPVLAQGAKDDLYHVCTRAFTTEDNDTIGALFFYSKEES